MAAGPLVQNRPVGKRPSYRGQLNKEFCGHQGVPASADYFLRGGGGGGGGEVFKSFPVAAAHSVMIRRREGMLFDFADLFTSGLADTICSLGLEILVVWGFC